METIATEGLTIWRIGSHSTFGGASAVVSTATAHLIRFLRSRRVIAIRDG